jgi:cytochrome bd-type quinol oxidase subunit 2
VKLIHTQARTATFKRDGAVCQTNAGRFSIKRGITVLRGKFVPAFLLGISAGIAFAGHAMAQATSPTGGLGAQVNTMSSEGLNSGSQLFGVVCYLLAAICFGAGVWALWQSRQPQNRESGHLMRGVAGLVLCGLFATAGVWINKASVSASGGSATINTTPQMVQFGTGG